MPNSKIIGIVLVRNEDRFLAAVLHNISEFCDRIIIADHLSEDSTAEIARRFCAENAKGTYHRIRHPGASHDLIKKYAGDNAWVFGVDGDELYDPEGLAVLRRQLLSGRYDRFWLLFGNVINCTGVDYAAGTACGYAAPPCRSMTKLYNFKAIWSWNGNCPERLHGGEIIFRPGYDRSMYYDIYKETSWDEAVFRCLHFCFLSRSTLDKETDGVLLIRQNIADRMSENLVQRVLSFIRGYFGLWKAPSLKQEKYMRGELVRVDVRSFLPRTFGRASFCRRDDSGNGRKKS